MQSDRAFVPSYRERRLCSSNSIHLCQLNIKTMLVPGLGQILFLARSYQYNTDSVYNSIELNFITTVRWRE